MKKIVSFILAAALVAATAVTAACAPSKKADLKVGAIWVGDRTEGYTRAHDDGIKAAVKKIEEETGKKITVTYKLSVGEDSACNTELNSFGSKGYDLVFTNSYGHQFQYGEGADAVWNKYPNTTFVALTGDLAAGVDVDNYKNAFTSVYQSRYVSGVVAGYKLQELIDENKLTASNYDGDNIKIGYVGAYNYAEVVSGYTAFYLGLKSVVSNIVMTVQYTNSWYDFDAEKTTAEALIAQGCVIIGQHADSEGAPTACENALNNGTTVYSVGYNVDMLAAAPNAALTSATNVWEVYYYEAIKAALETSGKDIPTNWSKGYADGAVAITTVNTGAFTNAAAVTTAVTNTINDIKSGDIKVFNASTFTVGGANLSSYTSAYGMGGAECMKTEDGVTFFDESVIRSAPYFDIRIDGITEVGAAE